MAPASSSAPAMGLHLKQKIAKVFEESLRITVPYELDIEPAIAPCQNPDFGDYQCNNAMGLWSKIKGKDTLFESSELIGEAIVKNLPPSAMIESCSVGQNGFVNITLSNKWMAKSIHEMLVHGIKTWAPELPCKRAVVDFSSPNIAKEMHVGHLRSTIIGDTLARMLEYSNVEVLRRNHVGDWGTQFGMLIEFFFEKFPSKDISSDQAIGDLENLTWISPFKAFYKASKLRFDNNPVFKERAQRAVVSLQAGEEKYRKAWAQICEISRRGYEKVYQRLGVHLEERVMLLKFGTRIKLFNHKYAISNDFFLFYPSPLQGESFYNPYIPAVLKLLDEKGLVKESEGACVVPIEGKRIPLIVVKKDGGYNYASTDLAALWYRLNEERAEWIIYVTDVGQREHFEMIFSAAKRAGWLPADRNKYPKASHVGFGLVLGEDGKRFRTRSKAKEWTAEELDGTAEAVSYGAVKYADLKNNRTTNYTFNFDQMLNDKGNTAVYLQYAHARICSIIKRSVKDVDELKKIGPVELAHPDERALGLRLLQFPEIVEEACTKLLPSVICEYLYNLSEDATRLYTNCQVRKRAGSYSARQQGWL
ncbi:hypothetical protein DH2020_006786 [Rehmannia glutinosa]|uniref:arginine--tRNA ligase n=1 Tax=Rehmannia glutinosa TaxID=99300 RepID=A0ABR0XJZ3_REHGL